MEGPLYHRSTSTGATHNVYCRGVKSRMLLVGSMCGVLFGGIKPCLFSVGAMHDVSCGGIKPCMVLVLCTMYLVEA